jgi:hypothetical protein
MCPPTLTNFYQKWEGMTTLFRNRGLIRMEEKKKIAEKVEKGAVSGN